MGAVRLHHVEQGLLANTSFLLEEVVFGICSGNVPSDHFFTSTLGPQISGIFGLVRGVVSPTQNLPRHPTEMMRYPCPGKLLERFFDWWLRDFLNWIFRDFLISDCWYFKEKSWDWPLRFQFSSFPPNPSASEYPPMLSTGRLLQCHPAPGCSLNKDFLFFPDRFSKVLPQYLFYLRGLIFETPDWRFLSVLTVTPGSWRCSRSGSSGTLCRSQSTCHRSILLHWIILVW